MAVKQHEYLEPRQLVITALLVVIMFGLGIFAGYASRPVTAAASHALREDGYQYIHPILLCNLDPQPQNEDKTLSQNLTAYLKGKDVGVYYINPTAGTWAGTDYNESFSPASMLKVPIMTAIFRASEDDPSVLTKSLYYDGSFDLNAAENIKPIAEIEAGHSYTVSQLIGYMISDSDNNATYLLGTVLSTQQFDNIYTDLGIEAPTQSGPVDYMSPKTYTLFLRLLYNSSYLSRTLSEKALSLMTTPDFPPGILAGVPTGTQVAQKFGDRKIVDDQGNFVSQEVHNCGIVYSPKGDYILCVMTRGSDIPTLESEIAGVSKLVYQYVNPQ